VKHWGLSCDSGIWGTALNIQPQVKTPKPHEEEVRLAAEQARQAAVEQAMGSRRGIRDRSY